MFSGIWTNAYDIHLTAFKLQIAYLLSLIRNLENKNAVSICKQFSNCDNIYNYEVVYLSQIEILKRSMREKKITTY